MTRLPLLLALLAGCSGASSRLELKRLDLAKQFTLSGKGSAYALVVGDGVAYASDSAGFRAYRLNAGDDAAELAAYTVEPESYQTNQPLALRGHLLAVAHASRIALVDVADPARPQTLATLAIGSEGAGRSLAFDGDYLYWGGTNLQRANVADPAHPGTPEVIWAQRVVSLLVAGGRIYASGDDALTVLALPDPAVVHGAAPTLGTAAVFGAGDLVLNGSALYGSAGGLGNVWVVDVADPRAPRVIQNVTGSQGGFNGPGAGLVLQGEQLLAPSLTGLTYDYDVSDPLHPKEVDARLVARGFDDRSNFDAARSGDLLLLANDGGLLVLTPSL